MRAPTNPELEAIRSILKNSLDKLIESDSDIFNAEIPDPPFEISEDAKILARELHETTINHRLAVYLENQLVSSIFSYHKVDIEYNRDGVYAKEVKTTKGILVARPDIVIHTRRDQEKEIQHLLIIEAKKHRITCHDVDKVEGFITDDNYGYLFGFTVSYCVSSNEILGTLYYSDGNHIQNEAINLPKRNTKQTN